MSATLTSGVSVPTIDDFNTLAARVDTLEGQNNSLDHRLTALEQRVTAQEQSLTALEQRVAALEESNAVPPSTFAATLALPSGGDDTQMINNTLAQALSSGGGVVHAPGGNVWRHDGLIEVPGGVTLQGDGDSSELRSTNQNGDGWPTLTIHLTGEKPALKSVRVSTEWRGDRQGTPYAQAVWVDGANGFLVDQVHVFGAAAGGIFCERSNNGVVSKCFVENTLADGIGIGYSGSSYNLAINNTVNNAGDDGISIVSYTDDPQSTGNQVLYNTVRNGSFARGIVDVGGRDSEIRSNTVENIRCAGIFTIQDEYWGTYAPIRTVIDSNIVSNCVTPDSGYAANFQIDTNTTDCTLTNNVSLNPQRDDYAVHGSVTGQGGANEPSQSVSATNNIPPTDPRTHGKPRPKLSPRPALKHEPRRVAAKLMRVL